jgi:hypothetical protein
MFWLREVDRLGRLWLDAESLFGGCSVQALRWRRLYVLALLAVR